MPFVHALAIRAASNSGEQSAPHFARVPCSSIVAIDSGRAGKTNSPEKAQIQTASELQGKSRISGVQSEVIVVQAMEALKSSGAL
jgi:hypothetical protein